MQCYAASCYLNHHATDFCTPMMLCSCCNKTWLDSGHLDLLPTGIQRLVPVELTAESGLGSSCTHVLKAMPS